MRREYWIAPCSGRSIDIAAGQTITIIDVEGGQAADFFAERAGAPVYGDPGDCRGIGE